ncbi:MAG: ammonium transporter [Caldilineales bacterium]|nr:ammonium transporter [Caldilineales bacterium]MDW8319472.1 ammonium transporter [Anaerolineae bacterium]
MAKGFLRLRRLLILTLVLVTFLALAGPALAQDEPPSNEALGGAINVIWVLIAGFLVFFMQAGFAMVEGGMCRAKNIGNLMLKNLMDFSVGSLLFFAVGYGLMFGADRAGLFGTDNWFLSKFTIGEDGAYNWAFFMYQLVFAATAATIVSGAVAERLKVSAYLIYTVVISGLIYPIVGHWIWGGGWLADLGMIDFAGSTVVHSVGGWAGLAGAAVLGPRIGKFNKDGSSNVIPGHSLALAALGVFILWFGWFGFNPGSTLSGLNGGIGYIAFTTNIAAAAAATSALIVQWIRAGHPSVEMALNGALAGLVAITAGCAVVTPFAALLIGLLAGGLVVLSLWFIERVLRVDDPVGAVSVHATCGIFGTLMVGLFASPEVMAFTQVTWGQAGLFYGGGWTQLGVQALGVVAVGLWAFIASFVLFRVMDAIYGIRVSVKEELEGLDISEHGTIGYPEFGTRVVAQPAQQTMPG